MYFSRRSEILFADSQLLKDICNIQEILKDTQLMKEICKIHPLKAQLD